MIRLLKPLEYYQEKYGTWMFALNKLYLMMEKQHNRGQEGAGMACVKFDGMPGTEYIFRERAEGKDAITEIFGRVQKEYARLSPELLADAEFAKNHLPFAGQLYMGHLRYSTTGKKGLAYVHPFLRRNNWQAKNLCICGNFNMTNIDEICQQMLDREAERNFVDAKKLGLEGMDITSYIDNHMDMANVLRTTMPNFDGGYVMCGLTGSGEMFSMRDPWGIRPAFYYQNDEFVAVASERPVLQTTFDLECDDIKELQPGNALLVNRSGEVRMERILEQRGDSACSFERIYFSRGSDRDIYRERKRLGELLVPQVLDAVDGDINHTVFSFIPNTAEVAYYGLLSGFKKCLNRQKVQQIQQLDHEPTDEELHAILDTYVRSEKVAIKDIKLRTFITEGNSRNDLASHVYDITYESIEGGVDNLVIIDDSIVRGTTLKESILRILDRLHPKKIVVVSSAPQIRYPDYYGIDMAHLEEFCVFRATVALIQERGMEDVLGEVYSNCLKALRKPKGAIEENPVKGVYKPFTVEEINRKIVEMLRPQGMTTPVELVFQSIEGLHEAIPYNHGDWYFTGDYPTDGGMRQVCRAYINFYKNIIQNS